MWFPEEVHEIIFSGNYDFVVSAASAGSAHWTAQRKLLGFHAG
jgi:hypothetical protein